MKKLFLLLLLMVVSLILPGCYRQVKEEIAITEIPQYEMTVGDKLDNNNVSFDETSNILVRTEDGIYALTPGNIIVNIKSEKYYITVNPKEKEIKITTTQKLKTGEQTRIIANVSPRPNNQNFIYSSTDEEVVKVNEFGQVSAVGMGLARIIVTETNTNISKEITYIVLNEDPKQYEEILKVIIEDKDVNLDLSTTKGVMDAIIKLNSYSLVGICGYRALPHFQLPPTFGSGIIYKSDVYYKDGEVIKDFKDLKRIEDIDHFDYYVITNQHLINKANNVKIFIGHDYPEIDAEVVQYDNKIDLALVKFSSKYYFPTAKLGDSDNITKGEFIISIGNGTGMDDFRTSTFGVISATKRYINTDTDGDMVADWDSEYIQHDASINECDSGGAIINMKGEIIGINSTKIIGNKFNNVSLAIPINLVKNIVSILETGQQPQRATLGVSIVDVSQYQQDKEGFLQTYPFLQIPDNLKYGFYVIEVVPGGVCDKAKVLKNDIIISFNGVKIKYSHQIRAELGKFLIGSGEKAELEVLRNGKLTTLEVVF